MNSHINNILTLKDKLFAMGEEIAESHIVALLLCSLPHSYDPLVTALEARPEDDLTLEFINKKLTDEFRYRYENRGTSSNTRGAANKAVNRSTKF